MLTTFLISLLSKILESCNSFELWYNRISLAFGVLDSKSKVSRAFKLVDNLIASSSFEDFRCLHNFFNTLMYAKHNFVLGCKAFCFRKWKYVKWRTSSNAVKLVVNEKGNLTPSATNDTKWVLANSQSPSFSWKAKEYLVS